MPSRVDHNVLVDLMRKVIFIILMKRQLLCKAIHQNLWA